MHINRSRYLAIVASLGGVAVACSSSPSTSNGTGHDGGSSSSGSSGSGSSSGSARDAGSSSGSSSGGSGSSSGAAGCPSGQTACAAQCCPSTSVCVTDAAGNKSCAAKCSTGSDCTAAATPCCAVLPGQGNASACLPNGTLTNQQCICSKASDCTSGCCAPGTDSTGGPVKPYICKAVDGTHYGCCSNITSCSEGLDCCLTITGTGSMVCEQGCQMTSTCGSGMCQPLTSGMCAGYLGSCIPK